MKRGQPILDAAHQRFVQEREESVVTQACLFCEQAGREWTVEGRLKDVRDEYTAHRLEQHPDVRPPVRRKRYRTYGQLSGFKSLDDNIAQARQQGAAGWAAPE